MKLKSLLTYSRCFFPSLIFNLRHLPFAQARKLPILLHKCHIINQSGKFIINGPVHPGMIRLGFNFVSVYPNSGIRLENRGTIIFNGRTRVGNATAISVGDAGVLEFGPGFAATAGVKLVCYNSIKFGADCLLGWETMLMDCDFHLLKDVTSGKMSRGYGSIQVGDNVWFANACKIYKNVIIPSKCTVGADTTLYKSPECGSYCLITNEVRIKVKCINAFRNPDDDKMRIPKS